MFLGPVLVVSYIGSVSETSPNKNSRAAMAAMISQENQKTRAASHRTHVLAKSKKARSPSPNWEINSQDFAPRSPSSAHSPNPSEKRLVSNSSVSIPSGSNVKTKKLAEPSAIKYRNANQPRGGSNGCIANTLMPDTVIAT
ncbi:hypothetical protein DFH08DRAFT_821476 [Mycena albidolilacea]|uniref:Uncharacterized protein n=1 Tax=Mycena albidolilacea TaxID=1033008 RepID=A0AAD6ZA69_9AGAR|nr:hypothetical protein DFH08DRAFT_821476 [Mycena albidolilacea]